MLRLLLVAVVLPAVLSAPTDVEKDKGQIWAVLVAGSNYYANYRHQADVCHAYQILHRHGVPDSNIIVMMYDDIANNDENPKKGQIFNKPGGPNVYGPKAVPKDYTGDNVTPENFVNVLTGNKKALKGVGSGKVLQSGPNDHVFINFVDHGGTGLIGFPNSVMHADDLIKALKTMHSKNMFKKLVFYMEACESGSMFNKILPNNIEIFATTAADPTESSYACYWSDELQTFLGDEYSVSWMEDIDSEDKSKKFSSETLLKQFKNVVKNVKKSHPSIYGEKVIDKDHVQDYIGKGNKKSSLNSGAQPKLQAFRDAVSSRDVALHTLTNKIRLADTAEKKEQLQKQKDELVKGRSEVDKLFSRVLTHLTSININEIKNIETNRQELSLEMMPCYKTIVNDFHKRCFNIVRNTYVLGHLYKLANLCALEYSTADIQQSFSVMCGDYHRSFVNVN